MLDELLLHEDDPMWFIFDDRKTENCETQVPISSSPGAPLVDHSTELSNNVANEGQPSTLLLDIDHNYFRPSLSLSPRHSQCHSPRRSPTLSRTNSMSPPRPSIAPPITSQLTASHFPNTTAQNKGLQSDLQEFDPLNQGNNHQSIQSSKADTPPKSSSLNSSYQTMTSLSSKLMSSLLKGGRDTLSGQMGTHNYSSMDSILNSDVERDEIASPVEQHSSPFPSSYQPFDERSKSPHISTKPLPVATNQSLSSAISERSFTGPFTHSPFASATITHGTSPFAPSVYVPPSGAPGFKGDRYDWDKGFSDALESEWRKKIASNENGTKNDGIGTSSVNIHDGNVPSSRGRWGASFGFGLGSVRIKKSNSQTPPHSILGSGGGTNRDRNATPPGDSHKSWQGKKNGSHNPFIGSGGDKMGEFIEQTIGGVELLGRKSSSAPVLTLELASMVCNLSCHHELYRNTNHFSSYESTFLRYHAFRNLGLSFTRSINMGYHSILFILVAKVIFHGSLHWVK